MLPVITPNSSAKEIQSACSEWGAFYFPFPHDALKLKLFDHDHPAPIIKGGLKRGYLGFGVESGSSLFEAKQGFSFGKCIDQPFNKLQGPNVWPIDFSREDKQSLIDLFADLCQCSLLILESISLSLGKDKEYLGQYCKNGDSISICRIFNYLSIKDAHSRFPGHSKYAGSSEHTDWGFITLIIAQDRQFGLEIFKENQWIPICGKKDFVIVNIGDYLSSLTRGNYHSPLHRVVLDEKEGRWKSGTGKGKPNKIVLEIYYMKSGMRSLEMVIRKYSTRKEFLDILGLSLTASKKEIKSRYYELAKKHHPDKARLGKSDFIKIKNAYEILQKDPTLGSDKPVNSFHSNQYANYSKGFEPSKIITRSLLMGIGSLLLTVIILEEALLDSRTQAIEDAWDRYREALRNDGLDKVLDYTSNGKKNSTK